MNTYIFSALFIFSLILNCNGFSIPNSDSSNKIKVYNFGTPSNLKEAFDWKYNGFPKAKVDYLKVNKMGNVKMLKSVTNKPFNFNITNNGEKGYEIYKNVIGQAEEYISKAFEIYETINVHFYIEDFCKKINNTMCNAILGMTFPPVYIPLKESMDSNTTYVYPQALVKQLNLDKDVSFTDTDFIIYLNSKMATSKNALSILTHEMFHGLGIMSNGILMGPSMLDTISSIGSSIEEDMFVPYIYYDVDTSNSEELTLKDINFLPFTVYEKNLVLTSKPDDYFVRKGFEAFYNGEITVKGELSAEDLNNQMATNMFLVEQYEPFMNNTNYPKSLEIAENYKTVDAVSFKTTDGELVTVQTFDKLYASGSSICHIAYPKLCNSMACMSNIESFDNDYLMYYSLPVMLDMTSFESIFKNQYGIIGPKLMKIMKTMGWTEKNTPPNNSTYYVDDFRIPDVVGIVLENQENNENNESSGAFTSVKFVTKNIFVMMALTLCLNLFF